MPRVNDWTFMQRKPGNYSVRRQLRSLLSQHTTLTTSYLLKNQTICKRILIHEESDTSPQNGENRFTVVSQILRDDVESLAGLWIT